MLLSSPSRQTDPSPKYPCQHNKKRLRRAPGSIRLPEMLSRYFVEYNQLQWGSNHKQKISRLSCWFMGQTVQKCQPNFIAWWLGLLIGQRRKESLRIWYESSKIIRNS